MSLLNQKSYWRLNIQRPGSVAEVFDLRTKRRIYAGDDSHNDVPVASTAIPFHFLIVKSGFKAPSIRLTKEIRDSLKGDVQLKKDWKTRLYEGAEYQVINFAEWEIDQVKFRVEKADQLALDPLGFDVSSAELKHWARSFGYAVGGYVLLVLLLLLLGWVRGFWTTTPPELAVQKITVADAEKLLKKPTPVPVVESTPLEEEAPAPKPEVKPVEKQDAPKLNQNKPSRAKPATAPKVAQGKTGGDKPRDVRSMGLFAVQTSPGTSRVSMKVANPQIAKKTNRANDPQLGLGNSTSGIGFGDEGEGVKVASLGQLSGEAYRGGLSDKLAKAKVPSIALVRKEVEVRGALDPAVIRQIIEERLSEIRYCYENALLKYTSLAGKVSANWTIQADGSVANISSTSEEISQPVLHPCVKAQIKNWKFPKPKGGGVVHVRYPFVFNPVGGMN